MNKRKITEIVKFNVEKNIQNKGFVILNLIMCILVIIVTNLSNIGKLLKENNINLFEEEFKLEIVDETGLSKGLFEDIYIDAENVKIDYVDKNNYNKDNIIDDLIIIEFKINDEGKLLTKVTSKESIEDSLYSNIIEVTKNIRNQIFAKNNNISIEDLENLSEEPEIERVMLGIDAENSDTKEMIKTFSIVIVYMVLILVLARITSEIANEKVSKSIEYVLTSVEAKEYMLAKVLGVTITIIIQLLYTLVYYLIGNSINMLLNISSFSNNNMQTIMENIDFSIISYILVMAFYLIFTVFFMCMIQAAISSRTTSVAEASNTTGTLIMIVMILYFISLGAISPYTKVTTFMYILSCIPIVSTFFVPSMMIIGQATTLQIVISFIVLIVSTPILFGICSKKFKAGILDYSEKGKKSKKSKKTRSIKEEQEFLIKSSRMKRFSYVIGLALILWISLQQIGSLILPYFVNTIFSNVLSEKSITWIYYSIISIISLVIPSKLINSYVEDEYKEHKKIEFKEKIKYLLIGFGLITVIRFLEELIIEKIGSNYQVISDDMLVSYKDGILDKILFFIGIAIVPGIFEELFVRKAILNYGKQFGNYFTIIVSSLIFGLLHMNLQQGIFAVCIGLVFAIIMLKTGDIKLTILLHIFNNGLVALYSIFENHEILLNIIDIATIIFGVIGILVFIIELFKNKGIKFEKEKFKEEYKMIFMSYTFDIVLVLFIILTIVSEKYLRII